jgi:mono/diheme cytochrome c family protein
MISASMRRSAKVLLTASGSIAVAAIITGCGTERIKVPQSSGALYHGALLFSQRCSGCHTLSYAATHGSASNVRTREVTNGPNFNVRCERPVSRVLYAIENGGFSGGIMPQNVVVGQDAIDVAEFVATYAGRQAPRVPGVPTCKSQDVGVIPPPASATTTSATTASATTSTTTATATTVTKKTHRRAAKPSSAKKKKK